MPETNGALRNFSAVRRAYPFARVRVPGREQSRWRWGSVSPSPPRQGRHPTA